MSRKRLGLLALAVALLGWGTWTLSRSRTYQVAGRLIAHVDTTEPVVALTFDDGPIGHGAVLDTLKAAQVPATFFVVGQGMERGMAIARRMVADGHELGNHSFSHRRMVFKSPAWIAGEIERTDHLIRQAGFQGPIHVRPPYGKKLLGLPLYLASHGRTTVMWDVEPESDGHIAASADRIVADVLARARPGSIILLHGAYPETPKAVGPIITGLQRQGMHFVTVSTLLTYHRPS